VLTDESNKNPGSFLLFISTLCRCIYTHPGKQHHHPFKAEAGTEKEKDPSSNFTAGLAEALRGEVQREESGMQRSELSNVQAMRLWVMKTLQGSPRHVSPRWTTLAPFTPAIGSASDQPCVFHLHVFWKMITYREQRNVRLPCSTVSDTDADRMLAGDWQPVRTSQGLEKVDGAGGGEEEGDL